MTSNDVLKDICGALGIRRQALQSLLETHGFTASNSLVTGWFCAPGNPRFRPVHNWPLSTVMRKLSNGWLEAHGAQTMSPALEAEMRAAGGALANGKPVDWRVLEQLLSDAIEARPLDTQPASNSRDV